MRGSDVVVFGLYVRYIVHGHRGEFVLRIDGEVHCAQSKKREMLSPYVRVGCDNNRARVLTHSSRNLRLTSIKKIRWNSFWAIAFNLV